MKYYLVDLYSGTNINEDDRRDLIYAKLVDKDGNLSISATLKYILEAIKERNLQVENLLDALIQMEKLYSVHRKMFQDETYTS